VLSGLSAGSGTIAALQQALAAEHAASYGYGVIGSHLSGAKFAQASADWVAHERARDSLTAMITDRGAQPTPAAVVYQLPVPVSSPAQAVVLATVLEHQVAAAYPALVAVSDPALRAFAAGRMATCAVAAARWSGHSQAFPGL
jgi:hypothetical protein